MLQRLFLFFFHLFPMLFNDYKLRFFLGQSHVFDGFWTKPCCITSGLLTMKPLPRLTCPSCGLKGRNLGHDLGKMGYPTVCLPSFFPLKWPFKWPFQMEYKLEYPPFFEQKLGILWVPPDTPIVSNQKNKDGWIGWWSGTQTALTSCSFSSVSAEAPVEAGTDRLDAHNTLVLGYRIDLQNLISIVQHIPLN